MSLLTTKNIRCRFCKKSANEYLTYTHQSHKEPHFFGYHKKCLNEFQKKLNTLFSKSPRQAKRLLQEYEKCNNYSYYGGNAYKCCIPIAEIAKIIKSPFGSYDFAHLKWCGGKVNGEQCEGFSFSNENWTCTICKATNCWMCGGSHKDSEICNGYKKREWLMSRRSSIMGDTKPCPKCIRPILKGPGCNRIINCDNCQHSFFWTNGWSWVDMIKRFEEDKSDWWNKNVDPHSYWRPSGKNIIPSKDEYPETHKILMDLQEFNAKVRSRFTRRN